MNRGRGRGRGGSSSRGRGRDRGRGGRSGVPTSHGYATQQPTSFKYFDDLYDDFKVYGHFGSESDDDNSRRMKPKQRNNGKKPPSKKPNTKVNTAQFAYRYDSDDSDKPAAAGLGFIGASTSTAATTTAAFGRSKYTKMMVFHKSTASLNNDSEMSSEKEVEPSNSGSPTPAVHADSRAGTSTDNQDIDINNRSSDASEEVEEGIENASDESEIDELLSSLSIQDPQLQKVVQKLTRKERREKRYQELLDISDGDISDEDDLIDNTGDYDVDYFLSGDDEDEVDEDQIGAMLDYIENTELNDDGEDELRKYYQTLVKKLSAMDQKLATEETQKQKGKGKRQPKVSANANNVLENASANTSKQSDARVDESRTSLYTQNLQVVETEVVEAEVLLEPYSDEEPHIVATTESVSRRNRSNDSEDALSEEESDADVEEEADDDDDDDDYADFDENDYVEEDEDDDQAIELNFDDEQDEDEEDDDELSLEDDDEEPIVIYEEEEVSVVTNGVPPSLQRGYNAISKYSAREARQRRMLKTEAFEFDSAPHLTDKQRRKLEKKAERERKKEKNVSSKKQKKMMKEMDENVDMRKIDQKLQNFIRDDSISSFQMAPMAKHTRRQIHLLATAYNLKSKSLGSGSSRYPVLSKTDRTFIPSDRRYIERFISEAQSTLDATGSILRKHLISNNVSLGSPKRQGGSKKEKGRNDSSSQQAGPSHGYVVASNAEPISHQNIGHQMLAAMGWRQGDSLGAEGTGITAPIEAIVRKKRIGLGM